MAKITTETMYKLQKTSNIMVAEMADLAVYCNFYEIGQAQLFGAMKLENTEIISLKLTFSIN